MDAWPWIVVEGGDELPAPTTHDLVAHRIGSPPLTLPVNHDLQLPDSFKRSDVFAVTRGHGHYFRAGQCPHYIGYVFLKGQNSPPYELQRTRFAALVTGYLSFVWLFVATQFTFNADFKRFFSLRHRRCLLFSSEKRPCIDLAKILTSFIRLFLGLP